MPREILKLALSRAEAARALGVSERLLWELTRRGELPHVRLGNGKFGRIIYPVRELEAWLSRRARAGNPAAEGSESPAEAYERGC